MDRRSFVVLAAVALLAACDSDELIQTAATVKYSDLEGGRWYLLADGGEAYVPTSLPEAFEVEALRVDVRLRLRPDMVSVFGGKLADVLSIERRASEAGYAGAWLGTKYFYSADGALIGWSPDWYLELTVEGKKLRITRGPSASVADDGSLVVDRHEYPATYPPGPPGHCVPWYEVVTGGTGQLAGPDDLELTLDWTQSCGGQTGTLTAKYVLTRLASPPEGYIPMP